MPPLASSLLSRSAAAGGPGPARVTTAAAAAISKPAAAEAGPSPSPSASAPHHPLPARGQAPRKASASSPFASALAGRLFGVHRAAARSSSSATAVFERRFASAATKNAYDEILTSLTKPGGGADFGLRARLADFGLARVDSDPDPDDKLESGVIAEGADANENGLDGVCDDDVSVVAESTVTTTVDGEGNVVPKSPEDDEGGFTLASPTEAASTSGFDQTSVDSGVYTLSCCVYWLTSTLAYCSGVYCRLVEYTVGMKSLLRLSLLPIPTVKMHWLRWFAAESSSPRMFTSSCTADW